MQQEESFGLEFIRTPFKLKWVKVAKKVKVLQKKTLKFSELFVEDEEENERNEKKMNRKLFIALEKVVC